MFRLDRYHLTIFLLCLFEPVILGVSVTGYKGGEVILPCTGPNAPLSEEDLTFMWRFEDRDNVHDFLYGKDNLSKQGGQYKSRTRLLAPQKGDFSLTLRNLTENDAGKYTCVLPKTTEDALQTQDVVLIIREKPTPELQTPEPKKDPRSGSTQSGQEKLILFLILFILGLSA